jgi:hypothetical protein
MPTEEEAGMMMDIVQPIIPYLVVAFVVGFVFGWLFTGRTG